MSVLAESREGLNRAARHVPHAGSVGAYTTCLLLFLGLCHIESFAVAGNGPQPGAVTPEAPVPVEPTKWFPFTPSLAEDLSSDGFKQIAAKSAYPATDSPEKLTAEQLDAIAKLPPKVNNLGMQVHPAMVPLFRDLAVNYTGGHYKEEWIHFRLHTPEPFKPGKKYPLVVWLHGAGECGTDNVNQLSHLHHIIPYLVGPKKRDFFLLVPQCPKTHVSWEAPEICSSKVRADGSVECNVVNDPEKRATAPVAFTLAMIDAVMKQFPVDPNRVTIAGLSTGGDGTWRILERRPELFAAAAPVVSWNALHDKALRESPILKKIPIWAIYSSDDRGIDYARKEFLRVREAGCQVFKTEFGVCGHRAWTPAMLQGDVFGWLISRAKDGQRYYAAEPSPTDPTKVGIFADVTEGDLKRVPTKAVPTPAKPKPANEPSVTINLPETPPATSKDGKAARIERTRRLIRLFEEGKTPGDKDVTTTLGPREELRRLIREAAAEFFGAGKPVVKFAPEPITGAPACDSPSNPMTSGGIGLAGNVTNDQLRLKLVTSYLILNEPKKAVAVADKVKNRQAVIATLLDYPRKYHEVLDYVDRELDRMEQLSNKPIHAPLNAVPSTEPKPNTSSVEPALKPIAAGKKLPKDECGKEWAMSSTTQYGLFPNGWEQESRHEPGYIVNETGKQLRDRLDKVFNGNDLKAMKEFCDSFIQLDDIPLSSPWFDTTGGRLQGRIQYTLNEKAKPVVELLREIAKVTAESKKEYVELAKKALERIDAITKPKDK
jgi:predicted esterase